MGKIIIVEPGLENPVTEGIHGVVKEIVQERELPSDFYTIEQVEHSTTGLLLICNTYAEIARQRSMAIRNGMTCCKLAGKGLEGFMKGVEEYESSKEWVEGVFAFVFDPALVWSEEGLEPPVGEITGQHAESMGKYLNLIGMMVPPGENGPEVFAAKHIDDKYFDDRCVSRMDLGTTPFLNIKLSLGQRAYNAGFEKKR